MVETAPAVMGGDDGQRPAVLDLGWWPVAPVAEMAVAKAASTMAEAVAAMVVVAAAAVAARRRRQGGLVVVISHNPFAASAESLRRECKLCVAAAHSKLGVNLGHSPRVFGFFFQWNSR